MNDEILADRYHESLEQYYYEESRVPFSDYKDLEARYKALDESYSNFKINVFYYTKENKIGELMEYLKEEGIF